MTITLAGIFLMNIKDCNIWRLLLKAMSIYQYFLTFDMVQAYRAGL